MAPTPSASGPVAPGPPAAALGVSIDGTITDTTTGAVVGRFAHTAPALPARVSVSAAGYVTRETFVRSATPTVDLAALGQRLQPGRPQARLSNVNDRPTERERLHAQLAYRRPRGNTDIDVDPQTSSSVSAAIVVD